MTVALVAGAAGLTLTHNSNPASGALKPHVAKTLDDLPSSSRQAAQRTVTLTITTPGHIENLPAMVLPDDLAVTTTPISPNALITGSTTSLLNFPVTLVGRDKVMGFSIVRLGAHVASLDFAPLPSSTTVLAISPVLTGSTKSPLYAWANTTLGDPAVDVHGVISYLSTKSSANLNGFADAIAVNSGGDVVAVLSGNHSWYSAQFVARIALIVANGRGCHASLGVVGATEQGGGVRVNRVIPKSPAQSRLKVGDVITAINGHPTDTFSAYSTVLYLTPAYSLAHVQFVHQTTVEQTEITLGCAL